MIKLINIDLDGTLLQKHYIISKENMDAIEYAKSKGVLVGVNTGRNSTSAMYFSEKAGMNAPVVCCGGSLILEEGTGNRQEITDVMGTVLSRKTLFSAPLPFKALERAGDIIEEMDISFYAQAKGGYYIVGSRNTNEFVYDWDKKAVSIIDMGLVHYKRFTDFVENCKEEIVKMGFSSMNKDIISRIAERWTDIDECRTTKALGCILEITRKDANKGTAVDFLRQYYGLNKDEVACIGDDTNDVSMFKACGYTVGIADGCEEIKSIADYISATCEDNGVAKGIYHLLEK